MSAASTCSPRTREAAEVLQILRLAELDPPEPSTGKETVM